MPDRPAMRFPFTHPSIFAAYNTLSLATISSADWVGRVFSISFIRLMRFSIFSRVTLAVTDILASTRVPASCRSLNRNPLLQFFKPVHRDVDYFWNYIAASGTAASTATFQLPSVCLRYMVRYFPFSVFGFLVLASAVVMT